MTKSQLFLLGITGFLVIAEGGVLFFVYLFLKKIKPDPQKNVSLWEAPINDEANRSNNTMSRVFCVVWLIIMLCISYILCKRGGVLSNAPLISALLTPSIVALFNLRKRTGKSMFIIFSILVGAFTSFLVYLVIGLPSPVPILNISGYDVKMGQTTIQDLEKNGFLVSDEALNSHGFLTYKLFSEGEMIGELKLDKRENDHVAFTDRPIVFFNANRDSTNLDKITIDGIRVTEVTEEALKNKYGKDLFDVPKFLYTGDDIYWVNINVSHSDFWPSYTIKWRMLSEGITENFEITCDHPY